MTVDICPVRIGDRGYDIHIGEGLLEKAGEMIGDRLNRPWVVTITDVNVDRALSEQLEAGLGRAGIAFEKVVIEPGEHSKSMRGLEMILDRLLDLGVERNDMLLAFGGGVIGDLTGFAAAILKRGCRFAQVPTTLLAQVDSAVGGKTGVNSTHGKNLIGVFNQPEIVITDIGSLSSLPTRELKAGYAEVVKYGALGDEPFFAWLEKRGADILGGDANARRVAVKRACETKAEIVAADERESGVRALLNLGHTFGHALERAHGYSDALLHGEAVSIGMALAFEFSAHQKLCPRSDVDRLKLHLSAVGLPCSLKDAARGVDLPAETLVTLMLQDKKVERGAITLILARRLGEAYIEKSVDPSAIISFLKSAGAK